MRPAGKPSHCLDWDGLTYHIDPVQQRVAQIVSDHEQQVRQLERQLSAAHSALSKYAASSGGGGAGGGGQCQVDGKDELVRTCFSLSTNSPGWATKPGYDVAPPDPIV